MVTGQPGRSSLLVPRTLSSVVVWRASMMIPAMGALCLGCLQRCASMVTCETA